MVPKGGARGGDNDSDSAFCVMSGLSLVAEVLAAAVWTSILGVFCIFDWFLKCSDNKFSVCVVRIKWNAVNDQHDTRYNSVSWKMSKPDIFNFHWLPKRSTERRDEILSEGNLFIYWRGLCIHSFCIDCICTKNIYKYGIAAKLNEKWIRRSRSRSTFVDNC